MDFIDILEFSINISFPFSNSGTYCVTAMKDFNIRRIFTSKWNRGILICLNLFIHNPHVAMHTYKHVMLYVEHANTIFEWLKWSCLQIIYERYSCCSTEKVKQQDILHLNFCEEPSMIWNMTNVWLLISYL